MPRKCCVPACRGNYTVNDRVSVFMFPKDETLKKLWIEAIRRDNFEPSKDAVVCESHFHPDDIEWTSSMFDTKAGRLVTAPLDRPRLRKGAVPLSERTPGLPGCTLYLSTTSKVEPDDKGDMDDMDMFVDYTYLEPELHLDESVLISEKQIDSISLTSLEVLDERIKYCELSGFTYVRKPNHIMLLLISEIPYPKLLCYVLIDEKLSLSLHINDTQVKQIRAFKFPVLVKNTDKLTSVLKTVSLKFKAKEQQSLDDDVNMIGDILDSIGEKVPHKSDMISFLKDQIKLLKCKKSKSHNSYKNVELLSWS